MTPDSHPSYSDSADLQADEPLAASTWGSPPNRSRTKQWVAAAAVAGALLGTTGIAMAQTNDTSSTDSTAPTEQTAPTGAPTDPVDRSQAVHPGEELLTGDTAARVKAAAEAAVSDATVDRVETDAEGSPYEAHMTKSDGTHVTVKVDESFSVTAVEDDQGPSQGGARGQAPAPSSSSTSSGSSSGTA